MFQNSLVYICSSSLFLQHSIRRAQTTRSGLPWVQKVPLMLTGFLISVPSHSRKIFSLLVFFSWMNQLIQGFPEDRSRPIILTCTERKCYSARSKTFSTSSELLQRQDGWGHGTTGREGVLRHAGFQFRLGPLAGALQLFPRSNPEATMSRSELRRPGCGKVRAWGSVRLKSGPFQVFSWLPGKYCH